jgi:hypothetical protein
MINSSVVGLSGEVTEKLGKIPVRIFFLDNSSKMLLLTTSTCANDVVIEILQKMDLKGDVCFDYFALYLSETGSSIDRNIEAQENISMLISQWDDSIPSKLVFMIRLFLPSITGFQYPNVVAARFGGAELPLEKYLEEAEVVDRQLVHLQYLQAVFNVITGQYPTTPEQALQLGAIHFLHKFGNYDPSRHVPGFLGVRVMEFLPLPLLRAGDRTLHEWEIDLVKWVRATHEQSLDPEDRRFRGVSGLDPQPKYLQLAMLELCDLFGVVFFPITQTAFVSLPDKVLLGVHSEGKVLRVAYKIHQLAMVCECVSGGVCLPLCYFYLFYVLKCFVVLACVAGIDFVSPEPSRELFIHFSLENIEKFGVRGKPKGKRRLQTFFFDMKPTAYGDVDNKKFKRFLSFEVGTSHAAAICELLQEYQKAAIYESFRNHTIKSAVNSLKPDRAWRESIDEGMVRCAVVLLQAAVRGFLVRNRTQGLLDNHAALLIQSTFRRYRARWEIEKARLSKHSECLAVCHALHIYAC